MDSQDGQGPSPSKGHHKQRSSRVDVISEKEELVNENSRSNQSNGDIVIAKDPNSKGGRKHYNKIGSEEDRRGGQKRRSTDGDRKDQEDSKDEAQKTKVCNCFNK